MCGCANTSNLVVVMFDVSSCEHPVLPPTHPQKTPIKYIQPCIMSYSPLTLSGNKCPSVSEGILFLTKYCKFSLDTLKSCPEY